MANHELYTSTAAVKNSVVIQRNFNMASTLTFQEPKRYDATSTFSLLDTVTYTDPEAGLLFEGVLISKNPKASARNESIGWSCQDAAMRDIARTIYRTTASSTFKYNVIGNTQTTTVKDVLQEVLSSAASVLSSIDGYTLPTATTAVIPATTYSGQTYKSIIDDLMRQVPNWGYYPLYGASGTVTLTVVDFVAGGASQTITVGDG